jgi:NADH-quinone oxidoreductase subunit N
MNWNTVLVSMLPEHLLLAGIVLLLALAIGSPRPRGSLALALLASTGSAVAAGALYWSGYAADTFPGQFSVDGGSLLAKFAVLSLGVPALLMSRSDFDDDSAFHPLLLSSLYGACMMVSADSFLTLFIGLELMSLPVYVMVLIAYRRPQSADAALRYLVLGGAATAALLMGVSLLFGLSGSLWIGEFAAALGSDDTMARAAVALVLAAFFLKAAIVPFHAWAPDAYEAASVPVTAYMATVVKAAVLLALVRLFGTATVESPLVEMLALLPILSIVWGNLAAMRQASLRRMMGYSSIAHAGYLFFVFLGDADGRLEAAVFYVVVYGLVNLLAFASLPTADDDEQRDRLTTLQGLYHRRPYAAVAIAAAMLSLAGIPPLPGFVAKFLVFRNVLEAGYTGYAVAGLVASYLGIYFYLRVIQAMFMSPQAFQPGAGAQAGRVALVASVVCLVPVILLGIFPGWVLDRI